MILNLYTYFPLYLPVYLYLYSLNLFISGPIEINKSNTLFIDGRTGNFITLYVSVENPITNTNFLGLNTL